MTNIPASEQSHQAKFFNNCLIEPSLIITKSCAKPKVILSENYCILGGSVFETQLTLGQLKSPNTAQLEQPEMMVSIESHWTATVCNKPGIKI